jgi:hypothetical protein
MGVGGAREERKTWLYSKLMCWRESRDCGRGTGFGGRETRFGTTLVLDHMRHIPRPLLLTQIASWRSTPKENLPLPALEAP